MALWILSICLNVVIHPFLPFPRPYSLYIGCHTEKYKSISWIRRWLPFETYLKKSNYLLTDPAVDEFAIHKGHRYATCVIFETGFILWAGLGRSMADFEHFFKSIDLSLLSRLKAVAMDMNASFNRLFQKYCPKVPIVYDRYHMAILVWA